MWKVTILAFLVVASFSGSASAATLVPCNAAFTSCFIVENTLLQFPSGFIAISGDVIIEESYSTVVSDVFRIFNDFVDTGGGTGLGDMAFLYSSDDSTPLPDPSTYSLNLVTIRESPTGAATFTGNGTTYIFATPEPGTFGLLALALSAMLLLRKKVARMSRVRVVLVALLGCLTGFAQNQISTIDPLPSSYGGYSNGIMMGLGPAQSPDQIAAAGVSGLAFFTASYQSLGTSRQLPFNIVGTDPANGAATTTVPVVIVPIKVVYQTAGGVSLDGTNVVPAVQNSPIFLAADYTVGGTDLGSTQFGDALQRGEFWQMPGFSQNYHVLLGTPTIAPTVTVNVTSSSQGNLYRLSTGTLLGVVASNFFDAQLNALTSNYTANMLPIFLTDNVFEGSNGSINTCCILGYHNSQGPPAATAKTWIYAAYTEPGTFVRNAIVDVQALSHEIAEWLNDPFVGAFAFGFLNLVPPTILPGQGGACIVNFETGDPLESPPAAFTQVTNGTTYHLQDEVFLPWYLHTTPSFSVNGWYTLQNTFTTFATLCGPG